MNFPIGIKDYSIKRVVDFDMDNDGDIDLLLENSGYPPTSKLMLFENIDGIFVNISLEESGIIDLINPSGTNVIDLDNDGVLEIISGQSKVRSPQLKGELKVFKKSNKNKSIFLYLDGMKSNKSAVGAFVTIETSKLKLKKIVNYFRGGVTGQRSELIHFGLGEDRSVQIKVHWHIKTLAL